MNNLTRGIVDSISSMCLSTLPRMDRSTRRNDSLKKKSHNVENGLLIIPGVDGHRNAKVVV